MSEKLKYYGVYIPNQEGTKENEHVFTSYEDASRLLKDHKLGRFKRFAAATEARDFARHGSTGGTGNPNVVSESVPFRAPKVKDKFNFRRCIERDDYEAVRTFIWENPRYLISIGDTPTIMQEGPRYNAMHIAAKCKRGRIADLLLRTISSDAFTQLLYGPADEQSYLRRPDVLLDLYLNTPDKASNETPLHFAAKVGAVDVVEVLVRYAQCRTDTLNRRGQTPKEVACMSCTEGNVSSLRNKIHKLLDEPFFVPIWRAVDDAVQPVVGQPFSPKSPPPCPTPVSPLSPAMEIRAVAGPMNHIEAKEFHKSWKSPVKSMRNASPGTPHINYGILLRSPLDEERGLERLGRTLAKEFHISWKEYWPFLDRLVDIRSEDGLESLEQYLQQKIINDMNDTHISSFSTPSKPNGSMVNGDYLSPMSELCQLLEKCEINPNTAQKDITDKLQMKEDPYSLIENISKEFSQTLVESFAENIDRNLPIEDNVVSFIKKVRSLNYTMDRHGLDERSKHLPWNKMHCRIANLIAQESCKMRDFRLQIFKSTFRLIHTTPEDEMFRRTTLSPASTMVELGGIIKVMKCINRKLIMKLCSEVIYTEENSMKTNIKAIWDEVDCCTCRNHVLLPNVKKNIADVRRKIDFDDDADRNPQSRPKNEGAIRMNGDCKVGCPDDYDDDDDDLFYTPPSSPLNSEDEMEFADEGPNIFIYGNSGTSMDNAVFDAIGDIEIDRNKYPSIYRWQHCVRLHNKERYTWRTPVNSCQKAKLNGQVSREASFKR